MAGPRKERDPRSEGDLFDDLDEFFAPLDETEWQEGEEPAPSEPPPADPAAAEAVEADLDELQIDIPAEEELLAGTEAEVPQSEPSTPPAVTDAPVGSAEGSTEEPEGRVEPPPAPAEPVPPAGGPVPAETEESDFFEPEPDELSLADLELSGLDAEAVEGAPEGRPEAVPPEEVGLEDWDLGADQDWAAAEAETEAAEAGVPTSEREGPPADVSTGPVTEDDLRVPPPQYADLPGPEEGPEGSAEAAVPPLPGEAPPPTEEVTSLDDLEDLSAAADEEGGEPTFPQAAVPPSEGVPPIEEEAEAETGEPVGAASVEEAADHFAEGIPAEEIERELLADLGPPGDQTVRIDTEGTGPAAPRPAAGMGDLEPEPLAPTWEEEGARAIEPEIEEPEEAPPREAPAAGRNLVAAFASGILLAAMVIALLVIGKGPFAVFAGLVVLFGQAEFYAVMRERGYRPATLLGLVAGALLLAGAYLRGDAAVLFGFFVAVAASALWYMAGSPATRRGSTANVAVTILGVLYVPGLASFAFLLLALPGDLGTNVFLVVVGLTILYDVCAYAVGSWFGNRPLAPTISPSKSWEGAIGATVILLLVTLAAVPAIDPFTSSTAVGLAILIAIAAPIGDLVESAFKRDLGVKDMGTILPGHGGVLDRIDAILLTAPVAYYFLRIAFL